MEKISHNFKDDPQISPLGHYWVEANHWNDPVKLVEQVEVILFLNSDSIARF